MFTFRTKETQKLYDDAKKKHGSISFDLSHPLMNFNLWAIIPNAFPYDLVTRKHHLLVPKRKITSFADMTDAELLELRDIKLRLDQDYNCIMENLFNEKSIKDHLHLHLIEWKPTFFHNTNQLTELLAIAQINIEKNPRPLTPEYYLKGIRDEISEVSTEIKIDNHEHLTDELSDVLWDYFNLILILKERGMIKDVETVFSTATQKYQERLPAMLKGSQKEWDKIKKKQSKDLKNTLIDKLI